jgi:predicted nucleic acid-binding protein
MKTLFSAISLASALLGPLPRGPSRRLPKMQKTQELALEMAERHRFSIYDGLIVAAAVRAGCTILYTRDLQQGKSDRLSWLKHYG